MQLWEEALQKFITRYQNWDYIEGFLLCGSYAHGTQNEDSDIDIHIITNNQQNWCERGNTRIDGFLIEYFINPIQQIHTYLETGYQKNILTTANMFAYGVILEDKQGVVAQLKKTAQIYATKELKPITDSDNQNALYHLWDEYDELCCLYKNGHQTALFYNLLLNNLVKAYYTKHQLPAASISKIERILTDNEFQKRYHLNKMPSQPFIDLFLKSLKEQNLESITALYQFVINECGGFDINHFVLRIPIQK